MAVVTTLPGSRSAGMKTTDGAPARAACAATELARLPVEAQAKRVKPSSRAAVRATDTTRSLNEWVGLAESSFTHSGARKPTSAASASARTSGVMPGSRLTRRAGSWPPGSRSAYRQRLRRAGLDLFTGDLPQGVEVVGHLERAEALPAGVLSGERVPRHSHDRSGHGQDWWSGATVVVM